jgi:hypothetical protein
MDSGEPHHRRGHLRAAVVFVLLYEDYVWVSLRNAMKAKSKSMRARQSSGRHVTNAHSRDGAGRTQLEQTRRELEVPLNSIPAPPGSERTGARPLLPPPAGLAGPQLKTCGPHQLEAATPSSGRVFTMGLCRYVVTHTHTVAHTHPHSGTHPLAPPTHTTPVFVCVHGCPVQLEVRFASPCLS